MTSIAVIELSHAFRCHHGPCATSTHWGRENEIQPVRLNQRREVDTNPFAQGSAYEEAIQAPPTEEHLDAHQWDLEPVPFLEPMPVPLVPLPEEEPPIPDRDPDNHENSKELEDQVPEDQAQHD